MDHQRDHARFETLIRRLCSTLDRFTGDKAELDALIESWWKALRHVPYEMVERRVDEFLAKAGPKTPFPRPAQMRDVDAAPPTQSDGVNYQRGFWRSVIVHWVGNDLGRDFRELEQIIIANRETLGRAMLELLNHLDSDETQFGRTPALEIYARTGAGNIAKQYVDLGTEKCLARTVLNQMKRDVAA